MNSTLRLTAVLLALALPGAFIASWMTPAQAERTFRLDGIPIDFAGYRRTADERLDADIVAQIQPDDYLLRLYASDDGTRVGLYVGLYGGFGSKESHGPASCYPAQGWEVTNAWTVTVPLADGESLIAHALLAARGVQNELVLYWFQAAGRWPRRKVEEQLLQVHDALRGSPQYAFVRLSVGFSGGDPPTEALVRLATQLAPHVRRAVENPTG
jgi:EpsI family protein